MVMRSLGLGLIPIKLHSGIYPTLRLQQLHSSLRNYGTRYVQFVGMVNQVKNYCAAYLANTKFENIDVVERDANAENDRDLYVARHARPSLNIFKSSDTIVTLMDTPSPKPDWNNLKFGKHFTDHMLSIVWDKYHGWRAPEIKTLDVLDMHPAAKVLHYATEVFEGLKAYRGVDNKVRLFRPEINIDRMNKSCARAWLPVFDETEFLECIKKLVLIEKDWIPPNNNEFQSLYIRPTAIATDPSLGISSSESALLYVLLCPVGTYYPTGFKPVRLLADPQYLRAYPGGCGELKMGSNYAPTIYVAKMAERQGCQQVLWLYGDDHEVTEVGTMNIFMLWINENGEKELLTPPLSGIILPGVTRQSIIELVESWGEFPVRQRKFTMRDVIRACEDNRLLEMFGSGTACVVSPIGEILYKPAGGSQVLQVPVDVTDPQRLDNRLFKAITDIQYGRVHSDWAQVIC